MKCSLQSCNNEKHYFNHETKAKKTYKTDLFLRSDCSFSIQDNHATALRFEYKTLTGGSGRVDELLQLLQAANLLSVAIRQHQVALCFIADITAVCQHLREQDDLLVRL